MKKVFTLIALLIVVGNGFSQNNARVSKHFNLKKGIAIDGYDPVSYFSNDPVRGTETISYSLNDVTYLFSSEENRKKFIENPQKYIPQYGGWCAYAIGDTGKKVKVDPETYKIKDEKLYLFYNFNGYNTLKDWNENEAELLKSANINWKKIAQ